MPTPDDDLVSVVIPTRNRRDLLVRALASVKAQTWPHFEVIVVDDASSDDTLPVLHAMAADWAALRVLRNDTPAGGAGARNQGIQSARGRWIAFLDDDDQWLPAKLETQLRLMKAHPSATAVSCAYFHDAPHRRRRVVRVPQGLTEQQMLSRNHLGGASVCLASTATLRGIEGLDGTLRSGQDWDLWLRLFRAGPILVCDQPLAIYTAHRRPRISNSVSAIYLGRRRLYFRYRPAMAEDTRRRHLAHLLYFKAWAVGVTSKYRWRHLRQICGLVGLREGLRSFRWFAAVRLAGATE